MKFTAYLLTIFFCAAFAVGNYSEDLAKVLKAYKYDKECVFNHTQVDSKTLKEFPNCTMVFGVLVFNENTDLNVTQMIPYFANMSTLVGGFVVENTKFESMNFFTKPNYFLQVYGEKFGVYIRNNPKLTDYSMLNILLMHMDKNGKEATFEVINNKKLNATELCKSGIFHYFTDLRVRGNLKDCGCNGDEIDDSSLPSFKTCQKSYIGLFLRNMSTTDFSSLSQITHIKGVIDISGTKLEDLSFLKNLESFRYRNQYTRQKVSFNLQDNPNMKRFKIPETFTEIHNTEVEDIGGPEEGIALFNFENLHPDFCLTIEELNFFLVSQVAFKNLHSKICEEKEELVMTDIGAAISCRFESMRLLADNCYVILGDVVVDSGDEEYMTKLGETVYIYGSLTVKNTKLKSLAHIYNLKYIVHLGDGPVIQLISNKNLKSPYLEGLESVFVRGHRTAIIQDNHPDIFSIYGGNCTLVESTDMYRSYRTAMMFSGGDCGDPVEIESNFLNLNRTFGTVAEHNSEKFSENDEDDGSMGSSMIWAWIFILYICM